MAQITLNEGLAWLKTLKKRHEELIPYAMGMRTGSEAVASSVIALARPANGRKLTKANDRIRRR